MKLTHEQDELLLDLAIGVTEASIDLGGIDADVQHAALSVVCRTHGMACDGDLRDQLEFDMALYRALAEAAARAEIQMVAAAQWIGRDWREGETLGQAIARKQRTEDVG